MNHQIVLGDVAELNRDVPIPLYYQLKQFILAQISSGDWPTGCQLPSEQQFCEKFGISRPTVRQAISELTAEGHLLRKQRKVTVPKPKMEGIFFSSLQTFDAEMRAKNLTPTTRVLTLEVRAYDVAAEKLKLPKDAACIYLERLRFADGDPLVWVETYLPRETMPGLLSVDFERASLYETIESQYEIRIERVNRTFEAALASSREAEILGVKKGSPICFVKTTAYSQHDEPIEFSLARYRGDKSQFAVSIQRESPIKEI